MNALQSSGPDSSSFLLRMRLSFLFFLQFLILGSYQPVLVKHLQNLGFDGTERAAVMGVGPLAFMITPLFFGQIADRWFATQRVLSVSFLLCSVALWFASKIERAEEFWWMWGLIFSQMLVFAPTLGLVNSLSFHHLKSGSGEYPSVRVFGTIGWIVGTFLYGWYMEWLNVDLSGCLQVASGVAFLAGIYCLTLPHTPPNAGGERSLALGKVLSMLRTPSFGVFSFCMFGLVIFEAFYYFKLGEFLPTLGVSDQHIGPIISIGQAAEIVMMLSLPFFLDRIGIKKTMAVGIGFWGLRFGIFALGRPVWLVIGSQALHGICFVFVPLVAVLYVNRTCPPDVRASAQTFFSWITSGLGMFLGAYLGGYLSETYVDTSSGEWAIQWPVVWGTAAIGSFAVGVVFLILFRIDEDFRHVHTSGKDKYLAPPAPK